MGERMQHPRDLRSRHRVEPRRRLIQDEHVRLCNQLQADANPPHLTPANPALLAVADAHVTEMCDAESLEDAIVKRVFRAGTTSQAPPELPVVPEHLQPWLSEITRGAEKADSAEIESNPRAASVRLRAVRKTREPAS